MALTLQWQRAGLQVDFAQLAERPQLSYWWGLLASAGGAEHDG